LIDYVKNPGSEIHIDSLKLYPSTQYWYAENNSKSNTFGLETRLSVNRNLGAVNFGMNVGYTYLKINADYKKAAKYSMLQPKHLINGELTIKYNILNWSINGLYTVINSNIDVAVYKKLFFVSIAVNNIFDQHYSDFLGAEMPARWIAFGAKMRI
jgi:vitamin B12 transporter